MPRSYKIGTQRKRLLQKHAKLDLLITHHIRIWRNAVAIPVDQILDNELLIFLFKINDVKWDTQMLGNPAGILRLPILTPINVVAFDKCPNHVIQPLLTQQKSSDARIDATRHHDEYFWPRSFHNTESLSD